MRPAGSAGGSEGWWEPRGSSGALSRSASLHELAQPHVQVLARNQANVPVHWLAVPAGGAGRGPAGRCWCLPLTGRRRASQRRAGAAAGRAQCSRAAPEQDQGGQGLDVEVLRHLWVPLGVNFAQLHLGAPGRQHRLRRQQRNHMAARQAVRRCTLDQQTPDGAGSARPGCRRCHSRELPLELPLLV